MKKVLSIALSASLLTAGLGTAGASASYDTSTVPKQIPVAEHVKITSPEKQYETQGAVSWTYKAFKNAMRAGGWLLSQAVKPFSTKTATWIRNNSKKVADLMDKGEKWTEGQFTKGLKGLGAPDDVAETLAKFIVALI